MTMFVFITLNQTIIQKNQRSCKKFANRPPCFSGVLVSKVPDQDVAILQAEIHSHLAKQAIEVVHPEHRESSLYSRYFLVPKKDCGLLRMLNHVLAKCPFKMITVKQILMDVSVPEFTSLSRVARTAQQNLTHC